MSLPYTHESDFRQERDFSQKISATFDFIGVHWRPLGRVLLYLVLPLALVRGILTGVLQAQLFSSVAQLGNLGADRYGASMRTYSTMMSSPSYYLTLFLSFAFNVVLILSIYGYLRECLQPTVPGAPITPGVVWAIVRQRFLTTFFSMVGITVLIGLGFIALFVPGVYLAVALSLFFIVQLIEDTGFTTTVSRCLSLTKGKWWSTAGLIFIMILILYFILFGVGVATTILTGGLHGLFPSTGVPPALLIAFSTIGSFFVLLIYPPLLIALAFQYFNLVERREGVGLHQLVDQLGRPASSSASPTADTYRPAEEGEY